MPLFEYKCEKCGHIEEHYFHHAKYVTQEQTCGKCGSVSKKLFARIKVGQSEVPGYEKVNQDKLTLGKGIDSRQKWV